MVQVREGFTPSRTIRGKLQGPGKITFLDSYAREGVNPSPTKKRIVELFVCLSSPSHSIEYYTTIGPIKKSNSEWRQLGLGIPFNRFKKTCQIPFNMINIFGL